MYDDAIQNYEFKKKIDAFVAEFFKDIGENNIIVIGNDNSISYDFSNSVQPAQIQKQKPLAKLLQSTNNLQLLMKNLNIKIGSTLLIYVIVLFIYN
jgi:hypothetical protein